MLPYMPETLVSDNISMLDRTPREKTSYQMLVVIGANIECHMC